LRNLREQTTGRSHLIRALNKLLDQDEIDAMRRRLDRLIAKGKFPCPAPTVTILAADINVRRTWQVRRTLL